MKRKAKNDALALARLLKQGVPAKTLARQMGLDIKEVEASRNAVPLEEPQPGGYSIPGDTEPQKWSTNVEKTHDYTEVTYQPGAKRGRLSVYVGLDVATHPKHALAQGALLKTTMTRKTEGLEIRGLVVEEKGEREDGIITVGRQKNSPYTPLRVVKGGCRLDLPHFSCASASHSFDEDTGEHVWMVRNEDIKLKTREAPVKRAKESEAPPQPEAATGARTPPAEAEPEACFRAAVDAIFKAGQKLNRRHFFLSEDGVTRVWVDGSSLGYEQLADLNEVLPLRPVARWMRSKPDGRDLAVDFLLDMEKDPTRGEVCEWLTEQDRQDLVDLLPKEFK